MPWYRPDLSTLISRNQADIESEIPGANAKLRRTNLNIIAKILSLTAHGLYGFIAYVINQLFAATAETSYLDRIASFWLTKPRLAATYATGSVQILGTTNTVIAEGEVLIRDDGIEYVTDSEVIINAGVATVSITCTTAGQTGNAAANTSLTTATTVTGITSITVQSLSGGTDVEDDDSVRDRVHNRVQNPPHGGAEHDYVTWALEVAGNTRAWVYDQEQGAGTVVVRYVRDNDADIIPDANEVATTQAYMDALRPVGLKGFYVLAPIPQTLNFQIQLTPNTAAARAAVEAELRDMISREAEPGKTLFISHIREAISTAAGEENYVMLTPFVDVTHATGRMATFGTIVWL